MAVLRAQARCSQVTAPDARALCPRPTRQGREGWPWAGLRARSPHTVVRAAAAAALMRPGFTHGRGGSDGCTRSSIMQERNCGGWGPRFGKVGAYIQGADDAGCLSVFSHRTSSQDDAIMRSPCLTHTQKCRSCSATLAHRTTQPHAVLLALHGREKLAGKQCLEPCIGQRLAVTVPSYIPDGWARLACESAHNRDRSAHAPAPAHVPVGLMLLLRTQLGPPICLHSA